MKAEEPRHKAGASLNTNTGVRARQEEEREPKEEAGNWVCQESSHFPTSITLSPRWATPVNDGAAVDSSLEVEMVIPPHTGTNAEAFWHLSPTSPFKPANSYLRFYLMPELPGLHIN